MDNERTLLKELYGYRKKCVDLLLIKTNCDQDMAENIFIEAVFTYKKKKNENNLPDKPINVRGYLYGICHNLWLKNYDAERKVREAATDVTRYFYDYLPDHINGSNAKMHKENLLQAIQESLNAMGAKCRNIIRLFYYEEKSMTEIAKIMNFKTPVVATTAKYRCFKEFRKKAYQASKNQEIKEI
ncbi:MAG: sigma-70 family RNA polymerase sigma factor [Bacteroidota bacterium]